MHTPLKVKDATAPAGAQSPSNITKPDIPKQAGDPERHAACLRNTISVLLREHHVPHGASVHGTDITVTVPPGRIGDAIYAVEPRVEWEAWNLTDPNASVLQLRGGATVTVTTASRRVTVTPAPDASECIRSRRAHGFLILADHGDLLTAWDPITHAVTYLRAVDVQPEIPRQGVKA